MVIRIIVNIKLIHVNIVKKEFKLIKGEMLYKLAHLTFCSYKCRSEYKKIESEKMKNE